MNTVITYPNGNGTFNGTVCDANFNETICGMEINETYCAQLINATNCSPPTAPPPSVMRQVLSILLSVTIGIVMVGMGCGVDLQKLKEHLKKPTGVIVGFVCQFIIMPAIAFALAKIFQMNDVQTLALLIVGSCPGGAASNIICYWVDGDLDLSLTMTTISSVLGLGMMPLLLFIYSFGFSNILRVPFQNIGITLASLIVPIAIGVAIGYKFPRQAPKIVKFLSAFGIFAIIAVATISIVTYQSALLVSTSQIICAALFPIVGMSLGYGFSSIVSLYHPLYLHHYQRRTIALETGVQNTQLATAIIQLSGFTLFETGQIILFPAIYLMGQICWVVILLIPYRIYVYKKQPVRPGFNNKEAEKSDFNQQGNGSYNPAFEASVDVDPRKSIEKLTPL